MREYPQHEDLGLVDDDNTENLRKEIPPELRQQLPGATNTPIG